MYNSITYYTLEAKHSIVNQLYVNNNNKPNVSWQSLMGGPG